MKKIFLMAALVLSGLAAKAQVEPGTFTLMPKVGLNMATMTGGEDTKMKAGAVAGVEAEYRATDLIGVSAGLLYSMQGVRFDVPQGSSLRLMNMLSRYPDILVDTRTFYETAD